MTLKDTSARAALVVGSTAALLPFVSGGMALAAGAAVGVTLGNPAVAQTRALSRWLLAAAVIGLGAGMDLRVVARVGLRGFGFTVVSISLCLVLGALLTRLLRVDRNIGALISIGTAICGGSAIAAVAPVLRPKEHEVSVALATVFLLNGIALFIFPSIGHRAGLSEDQFGLWAALAIHDTSSVVGASMAYGPRALEVATAVKLARALWIAPVTLVVGLMVAAEARSKASAEARGPVAKPWFILGFLIAAALATFVGPLHDPGLQLSHIAQRAMASTLFLIGAALTRPALASVGVRPLVHGVVLWLLSASLSLLAVVHGLIGA